MPISRKPMGYEDDQDGRSPCPEKIKCETATKCNKPKWKTHQSTSEKNAQLYCVPTSPSWSQAIGGNFHHTRPRYHPANHAPLPRANRLRPSTSPRELGATLTVTQLDAQHLRNAGTLPHYRLGRWKRPRARALAGRVRVTVYIVPDCSYLCQYD